MKIIKPIIQYILPLIVAALLFGYAYRDFDWAVLMTQLHEVKLGWILLAVLFSVVSHAIRAVRWKLFLESLGFRLSFLQAFVALMIGYVSNLFVPRLGEIVRCTLLKKYSQIPTSTSLGTVVAERMMDVVSLVAVLGVTLTLVFEELKSTLGGTLLVHIDPRAIQLLGWGSIGLIVLVSLLILVIRQQKNVPTAWLSKIQQFLQGIWQGINSVRLLKAKKTAFALTILMWLCYYLTGYVGVFALSETSHLGWLAGLAILIMSSISLSIPVQGGIGAYHLLVSSTLLAYGISKDSAMLYVTLMHTSQLLMTLVGGGVCAMVGLFLTKNRPKNEPEDK